MRCPPNLVELSRPAFTQFVAVAGEWQEANPAARRAVPVNASDPAALDDVLTRMGRRQPGTVVIVSLSSPVNRLGVLAEAAANHPDVWLVASPIGSVRTIKLRGEVPVWGYIMLAAIGAYVGTALARGWVPWV